MRLRYGDAKHLTAEAAEFLYPGLYLTCASIAERCPRFPYSTLGGACDPRPPPVAAQLFHHTIPRGGSGTLDVGGLVLENACFSTKGTPRAKVHMCEYAKNATEYAKRLGVAGGGVPTFPFSRPRTGGSFLGARRGSPDSSQDDRDRAAHAWGEFPVGASVRVGRR